MLNNPPVGLLALFQIVYAGSLILFSTSARADVSEIKCEYFCSVDISGELQQSDVRQLAVVISKNNTTNPPTFPSQAKNLRVSLNSQGGDVAAAMKMGRLLRANEAWAFVRPNDVCASACVLILAGATMRTVLGYVVVHRPFWTFIGERPTSQVQKERDDLRNEMRKYLEEVNVSPLLLELMDSIPPEKARVLTAEELELFKLSTDDPVYQEKLDAYWAKKLGISRQELVRRKAQCSSISDLETHSRCISNLYFPKSQ